jgi:hypothetical protein
MWLTLLAFLLAGLFFAAGGLGFCYGLWRYRRAIWAMVRALCVSRRRHTTPPAALPESPAPASAPPMGVVRLYTTVRQWRIRRYLQSNTALALDVLRRDDVLAASAMRGALELDAKAGAPQRDTVAFPQMSMLYGGRPLSRALPKITPVALRRFSEYPPARRAINALSNPILDLSWHIDLRRPVGLSAHKAVPPPTHDQQARIVAATNMLLRPNNEMTWREFLEMQLEDLLVFGAGPFEVQQNRSDDRPLFLWPVDAQSVRINASWHPGSATYRYTQARGYVFSAMGTTDDVYLEDDELCYPKLNPRTSTPFGLGYLEIAFGAVNAFIGAFEYAERRASNNTPNFGIFLGENVTIDQVRTWQHYWENEIEGYGKVPILGGGRQPSVFNMQGTGEDALFLRWQEWLVRVIAMSFGLSPMRLGLERDVNRSTATTQSSDDWSTISPVANLVRDAITHWILWTRLGWTDLEFAWNVKTADELKQAEIFAEQYAMNAATIDEIRQAYERPPLEDNLGRYTKSQYESLFKPGASADTSDDATFVTPFDHEAHADSLGPKERAFLRELLRQQRYKRHGLAVVAE